MTETTKSDPIEALVDRLYAFHCESDDSRRQRLMDVVVTEDIALHGLQGKILGRQLFNDFFRGGGQLVRSTPVDRCMDWIRCGWILQQPDGTTARDPESGETYAGLQVSRLAEDGRISQIVTFAGLAPRRSRSAARYEMLRNL